MIMNQFKYYTTFISTLVLGLISCSLSAQVYPGDASNNGRVNNIDLLYMGYAFGSIGPARVDTGIDQGIASVLEEWEFEFPNGLNFAHADADGDGLIDIADMLAVFSNYNVALEDAMEEPFFLGEPGADPQLQLEVPELVEPLSQGGYLEIPIILGSEADPITNLNGLAFTIKYDPELIQEFDLEFSAEWMDPQSQNTVFTFQTNDNQIEEGEIDIAITQFGQNPITGWGEIAMLSIVIEDDLIGLLQTDSATVLVEIKDTKIVDDNFEDIPVVNDSIEIMVYHPDALTTINNPILDQSIKVFPNPARNQINIHSTNPIEKIELFDQFGQSVYYQATNLEYYLNIKANKFETGLYILKIQTSKGLISQKIAVLSP